MKKPVPGFLFCGIAIAAIISSCKSKGSDDAMILPKIMLKTDAGYSARDTNVAGGTALLTGIIANKTESNDVLKIFSITRSLDGGAASTVYNENLTAAQGDTYSKDYQIVTRSTAGTEKYIYTISNRDGLVNNISLTVTTH